jgi:hypothetical protein
VSQTYAWNDLNNDLVFQPGNATWNGSRYVGGEFGAAAPTTVIPNPNPFDKSRRRTYRRELTAGMDHELFPAFRLSGAFIYRKEYDTYGDVDGDIDRWNEMFSPIQIVEPGRDGRTGTSDDQALTVYNLNPGQTLVTDNPVNDSRLGVRYAGFEIVGTKRYRKGSTILAGYTYSNEKVERTSLANPNTALVNADGVSGGRRHNFKLSGSTELPYRITFGANLLAASGQPITRTYAIPACSATVVTGCLRQGAQTVNAEPRGSFELPARYQIDLRLGRLFDVAGQKFELGLDAYNLTNANTTYAVRTATGLTNIRYANDPNQPITQISTFNSPTGALGPRIVRVNLTYWFGAGASPAGGR